ncbi:MAG: 23S rRNA (uracil(1939)-C(5))-methyltransferase RlmD [Planctomycetota bacterium]|nr:MAG: 23S rRNA (uracil(1939)-C(5))-methyltransferase RlmD [Planctomycetota bacterium]
MSPRFRPCPHFGHCGGCTSFAAEYPAEFEAKRAKVEQGLRTALGTEELPPILPFSAAPRRGPRHFRSRLLWPVQAKRHGHLRAGLYAAGSHQLVELESCEVQSREIFTLAHEILDLAKQFRLAPYQEASGKGFLRAIDLRMLPLVGEALVTIVTKGGLWPEGKDFAKRIRSRASQVRTQSPRGFRVAGVVRSLHDEGGNRVLGQRFVPLLGRDHLIDNIDGLQLRLSAGSFYQSNWRAESLLFAPALALLGPLHGKVVLDVFAGVGSFGLRAARAGAKKTILIESHPQATRDAEHNVQRNQLADRVLVQRADATDPAVLAALDGDIAVLDPPRKGLGIPAAQALASSNLGRILYVSCYPKSLARDLAVFFRQGWRLQELRSADLFPRTEHLELVALLEHQ